LFIYGAAFSGLVIALRLIWVFPAAHLSFFIRKHFLHQKEKAPPARQLFIIGWAGMRGVISLAAALSLPETIANGKPFPYRDLIVFLTFSVILVTLVLQGLSLPRLIRALGLAGEADPNSHELEARRLVVQAALEYLQELRSQDDPRFSTVYDDLEQHYKQRLAALSGHDQEDANTAELRARYLELSRKLLAVERQTSIQLRKEDRITDDVVRRIERELDLAETQLGAADPIANAEHGRTPD
jgi:NhaP-type Na+/H+ or K+/H+ antiporter